MIAIKYFDIFILVSYQVNLDIKYLEIYFKSNMFLLKLAKIINFLTTIKHI